MKLTRKGIIGVLTSIKLTVLALVLLFAIVLLSTFAQASMGTFAVVEKYFRTFFLYAAFPGTDFSLPVFPAGGFAGALLLVNLVSMLLFRLQRTRRKAGLWLIHTGMILLVLGEFTTGMFATESRMAIEEGQTVNYIERDRELEFVLIEHQGAVDHVRSVGVEALNDGAFAEGLRLPVSLRTIKYYRNAGLERRPRGSKMPPSKADRGTGPTVLVWPQAPAAEDSQNSPAAYVEIGKEGSRIGTWLVSPDLGPQSFSSGGKRYSVALRRKREYLPFSLTLKDFRHDVYPGTNIPRNFSSLVRLTDREKGQDRDVLIYMNHPLRYRGKALYQASFGKQDTLSILQVVDNPGWLMPYFSFAIMSLGLLIQLTIQITLLRPAKEAN